MIVQSCTFTVHFPKNSQVRERLFDLEKHFEGFQKPFTLVAVPPDAPLEIPRIIAVTEHHHSQLIITGNSAQIITNFDGNYNKDVSKCIDYVRGKCNSVISSLKIMSAAPEEAPKFYFSGLSLSCLFGAEDGISDPISFISEKFLKCKSDLPVDESHIRLALVVDEKYYVNVMTQNFIQYAAGPDERGSFANSGKRQNSLQVTIDINDRYAFNHTPNYLSSEEAANQVIDLADAFAKENIFTFIRDGEINYARK